ncbi:DUF1648 domain-containing protein [Anoxynatronum sibiricum]|uniref:DUF5808 domain-containing protein n=1 Tax=Anoxynatronum sibiricum TaxID=210623 RepID=A0ABU9VWY1_9CLOT
MIQSPLLIQLIIVVIPLYVLGMLLPEFTRSTLFFGVTVPQEVHQQPELLHEKKQYRLRFTLLFTLGWLLTMVVSQVTDSFNVLYGGGIIVTILVLSSNYVVTHNRIRALKATHQWTKNLKQRVVVDTSQESRSHYLSFAWFILPGMITLLTWFISLSIYPQLPDLLPKQTDLGGEVTQWASKDFRSAFALPMTQLGMLALFSFIMLIIKKARKVIDPSRPEMSVRQHQTANWRWSLYILGTAIWMVTYFAILQAQVLQLIDMSAFGHYVLHGLSVTGPLVGIFVTAWFTGQSAERVKVEASENADPNLLPVDDDHYWKWGMFYFNPDDPTFWVEKRFGIGWTLNFANPLAVGAFVVLLLLIAAGILFDL